MRPLRQVRRPDDRLMMIRPTGEDTTMTREALLAERDRDAARLRAEWAQEKIDKEKEEQR